MIRVRFCQLNIWSLGELWAAEFPENTRVYVPTPDGVQDMLFVHREVYTAWFWGAGGWHSIAIDELRTHPSFIASERAAITSGRVPTVVLYNHTDLGVSQTGGTRR